MPSRTSVARRHGEPTEFELLTAVVFRHFAEADLDVALVEVGLGGRLDATHAWDGGVAVVTNVDLDHTDRLGTTIAAIAREKAAIIERGDLAVTGATGEALAIIGRRARRLAVPLTRRPAGGRARDGPRRARWSSCPASAPRGSGCVAGTRRPTWRSPTPCSTPSRRPGSRASTPRRAGAGTRARSGRAAWSCWISATVATSSSTVRTTRRGRPRWPGALDDLRPHLGPGRLTLVVASMADKDVDGVVAAMGAARGRRAARP